MQRIHSYSARAVCALFILFSCLSIAAAAPRRPIQSYDTYKSWFVVCDNTLTCVAKGFADVSGGAEITFERQAGPQGALTVSLRADHHFSLADISIDGQPAGLAKPVWNLAVSDDETSVTSDDIIAIRALVQRLRNASKITVGGAGEVLLDGFTAAMLRLDERQGRLDGMTALFRPGSAPASHVPVAPPLPKIAVHPINASLASGEEKRLIAAVRSDQKAAFDKEGCDTIDNVMEPEVHALDKKQALVFIPCIMGAYQGSSLAFIAPRGGGHARRLIAPTPYRGNQPDRSDAAYFTESDFDPKTGTLSMAAKGRGLADCGMSASWIWDGEAFHLSEMSLQQTCGGIEPGDWPTLFRSSH
ncbi:hypothetical protein ACVWZA_003859 [Sphingomonas sp. UYAg733]